MRSERRYWQSAGLEEQFGGRGILASRADSALLLSSESWEISAMTATPMTAAEIAGWFLNGWAAQPAAHMVRKTINALRTALSLFQNRK